VFFDLRRQRLARLEPPLLADPRDDLDLHVAVVQVAVEVEQVRLDREVAVGTEGRTDADVQDSVRGPAVEPGADRVDAGRGTDLVVEVEVRGPEAELPSAAVPADDRAVE